MHPFQELDDYLQHEYSVDYWSDEAIDYAEELFHKLQPADWQSLQAVWQSRPHEWQRHCADALSRADQQRAIPILLDMLQAPDAALVQQAAESLSTLDIETVACEVSAQTIKRLEALTRNRSRFDAEIMVELLRRFHTRVSLGSLPHA